MIPLFVLFFIILIITLNIQINLAVVSETVRVWSCAPLHYICIFPLINKLIQSPANTKVVGELASRVSLIIN